MAVNLSFIGGAGWQFFDDSGNPLSGGKIYTYAAGTTTPQTTYTSRTGTVPNANPIILDAAGRTPQQVWATEGLLYKYVVKSATDILIRTWDNIGGSEVASDLAQDLAAPTGSSLVGFTGFKAQVGTVQNLASSAGSDWLGFLQAGTGAVPRSIQDKLRETVCPEDFGAVGNGVADDTNAWLNIRDYAISQNGVILNFTGNKTYTTKNPYVFNDIPYLIILGNGARWINTLGTSAALPFAAYGESLVYNGPFSTNGAAFYGGGGTHPYDEGQTIQTVAAGATSITLTGGATPNIAAGDRMMLYGFDCQITPSFPPCARNFEIVTVTSVAGSSVNFKPALRFNYREDWPDNALGGVIYGAGRMVNLDRANMTMSKYVYMENLHFIANPNWTHAYSTSESNGRIIIGNTEYLHLNNVKTDGGLYASISSRQVFENCVVGDSLVIDKLLDRVDIIGSTCRNLTEGAGVRVLNVVKSTVIDTLACTAMEEISFDACDLAFNDGTGGGGWNQSVASPRVIFNRPKWRIPSSAKKYLVFPNSVSTAFTSVSSTIISISLATYTSQRWGSFIRNGGYLYNAGVPCWRLTDLPYLSGTNMYFAGVQVGPFTSGDTLAAPTPAESIDVIDPFWQGASRQLPTAGPTSTLADPTLTKMRWRGHASNTITYTSENFPSTLDETSNSCIRTLFGLWRPNMITINVTKAYTGTDATAFLVVSEYNATNSVYATIDLETVGYRMVSATGNTAALGADNLPTFPTGNMESLRFFHTTAVGGAANLYTNVDDTLAPQWSVTLYGTRLTGAL
jgi:hypothetical protein